MAKAAAAKSIISLKVTLRGSKPPIWRRLLMPGIATLGELHMAIQVAMGWENCHLHDFSVGHVRYGDTDNTDDVVDENRMTLNRMVKSGVTRFTYTYDFGDDWEHGIVIEKPPLSAEGKSSPACVAGKRNCPPEDCGGIWGYQDLLGILADPAHPDHEERLEWIGGEFDPEAFSVEDADAALAGCFNRK